MIEFSCESLSKSSFASFFKRKREGWNTAGDGGASRYRKKNSSRSRLAVVF
uniref:Uncharacterized protein n=1 Tax=Anopheles minimus TaxID=112268 RepID=A0A182WQ63_9DIPT